MAGLVPAIYVLEPQEKQDVDARHKAGHDELLRRKGSPHPLFLSPAEIPLMVS
jgi:hypothetical protein